MTHSYIIERRHIAAIAEQIGPLCDGDDALLQDMLQGETSLIEIVAHLHEMRARSLEIMTGIKERKDDLIARERRIRHRADKLKGQIGHLLRLARLSRIELPEVTYSVRDGKPALKVVDPDAVPPEYSRIATEPDKALINESFADTEVLPNWLVWEEARDVVTARVK